MSLTKHRTPFDVPEIRFRIGQFLDPRDIVACTQVAKAWTFDFARLVWHTIELSDPLSLLNPDPNLDPATLSVYGPHVRIIKNTVSQTQIVPLDDPKVDHLTSLSIYRTCTEEIFPQALNMIHRNRGTLTTLGLQVFGSMDDHTKFELVDALFPKTAPTMSNLLTLKLERFTLRRSSFPVLLMGCPMLQDLYLDNCIFSMDEESAPVPFQHQRLTFLAASIEQVLYPERVITLEDQPEEEPTALTTLLAHFPNLEGWLTFTNVETMGDLPKYNVLKTLLAQLCPRLEDIQIQHTSAAVVRHLLVKGFNPLKRLTFDYLHLQDDLIEGLMYHKTSLVSIATFHLDDKRFDYDADEVFELPWDDFQSEGWLIQILPAYCSNLKVLKLPLHEMDMDSAELLPWACTELEEFRVRIKGLDTKELILSATDKWRVGRQMPQGVTLQWTDPITIGERAARHLLKFKKLNKVWLGYKTWSP